MSTNETCASRGSLGALPRSISSACHLYMAAVRAIEHQRPDRLFSDPLAKKLAGAEIIAKIAPRAQEYEDRGRPVVAVRTRFFDDFLMSSASSISQDFCQ